MNPLSQKLARVLKMKTLASNISRTFYLFEEGRLKADDKAARGIIESILK